MVNQPLVYAKTTLSPKAFGIPHEVFREPYQWDTVYQAIGYQGPFMGQCVPTGGGKSTTAMAVAQILKNRDYPGKVIILTSSKAHQDQLRDEFGNIPGVVDIRGHNAYPCNPVRLSDGSWECEGSSQLHPCPYRAKRQLALAPKTDILITNYSFLIADRLFSPNPVVDEYNLMIFDEAHLAFDDLTRTFSLELSMTEMRGEFWPDEATVKDMSVDAWVVYIKNILPVVQANVIMAEDRVSSESKGGNRPSKTATNELRHYQGLERKLLMFGELWVRDDNWERVVDSEWKVNFVPVWIDGNLAKVIYGDTPNQMMEAGEGEGEGVGEGLKVLFLSATLTPYVIKLLGLFPNQVTLLSYPSVFPLERRPVYYIPTVRINFKSTDADYNLLISTIDNIIRPRLDRKGILHSVSYARMEYMAGRSFYKGYMLTHGRREVRDAVRVFKQAKAPRILVSPSVSHGFDFPADEAEYVIQPKLPWPNTQDDPVMKRRGKEDGDYLPNIAMQTITQQAGRAMRRIEDMSESFILDTSWGDWFFKKYYYLAASWFTFETPLDGLPPLPPPALLSTEAEVGL